MQNSLQACGQQRKTPFLLNLKLNVKVILYTPGKRVGPADHDQVLAIKAEIKVMGFDISIPISTFANDISVILI